MQTKKKESEYKDENVYRPLSTSASSCWCQCLVGSTLGPLKNLFAFPLAKSQGVRATPLRHHKMSVRHRSCLLNNARVIRKPTTTKCSGSLGCCFRNAGSVFPPVSLATITLPSAPDVIASRVLKTHQFWRVPKFWDNWLAIGRFSEVFYHPMWCLKTVTTPSTPQLLS